MNNPNIIFIVLDTLRADRVLSTHKNINLTPFISSLLNNSIYFENCIANSPWTIPSHISMFTVLYQTQNKILSKDAIITSNKIPVLTEILKDMGYYTICFTENPYISSIKYGLSRGFDRIIRRWKQGGNWWWWIEKYDEISQFSNYLSIIDSYLEKRIKSKKILKFWRHIKFKLDRLIKRTVKSLFWKDLLFSYKQNTIVDLGRFYQIIKNNINNNPFYLFFNIMATHTPYLPIKEVLESFKINIKDFKTVNDILLYPRKYTRYINWNSKHLSKKKVRIIKKLYDASVFYADLIVNNIISFLKEVGTLKNSYIIITSDHGEHLGDHLDHYLWEHSTLRSVYKSLMRVPLLIYNINFEQKIVKNQVQLKDLFHTILHLADNESKNLDIRKSILHQIDTNSTPKYIFGEYIKSNQDYDDLHNHLKTIDRRLIPKIKNDIYFLRSNEHKYIKYNNVDEEFFDLLNDPHEQVNIVNENNQIYKKMKAKMENLLKIIKNPDELKDIITDREKSVIKNIISKIKG